MVPVKVNLIRPCKDENARKRPVRKRRFGRTLFAALVLLVSGNAARAGSFYLEGQDKGNTNS